MTADMSGGSVRVMLITGATEFIGSHLAIAASDKYVVRSLTRTDWTGPPAALTRLELPIAFDRATWAEPRRAHESGTVRFRMIRIVSTVYLP